MKNDKRLKLGGRVTVQFVNHRPVSCVLSQVGFCVYKLICLSDGNRLTDKNIREYIHNPTEKPVGEFLINTGMSCEDLRRYLEDEALRDVKTIKIL